MEGTSVNALEMEWGLGIVLWALNWDCGGDQYQKQEALNKGSDGVKTIAVWWEKNVSDQEN